MSLKPCVINSAVFAPVRSNMVFMAIVEPWRKISAFGNDVPDFQTASAIPEISLFGVESVFPNTREPVLTSKAVMSVNVPPISAARRMAFFLIDFVTFILQSAHSQLLECSGQFVNR